MTAYLSPRASTCARIASLWRYGFLGFLGFLGCLGFIPGCERLLGLTGLFGFGGLFGLAGLYGLAAIIEKRHRQGGRHAESLRMCLPGNRRSALFRRAHFTCLLPMPLNALFSHQSPHSFIGPQKWHQCSIRYGAKHEQCDIRYGNSDPPR